MCVKTSLDLPKLQANNLPHVYGYGLSMHMKIRSKFHIPIHKNIQPDVTFYAYENYGGILQHCTGN